MIEDFYKYSKISWKYLNEIWGKIKGEKMLIGGWAVHLLVNDRLKINKKKEYIGSKDIDLFVENLEDVYNILFSLGFKREDNRFFKEEKDFKVFIDVFSPGNSPDVIMEYAFINNYKLKINDFVVPYPEFLIVSKINTILVRGMKEKRIKDILDLFMLISFSKYDIDLIRDLIKKYNVYITPFIIKEIKENSYVLKYFDFDDKEIESLIKILEKILLYGRNP